ncbi:DNA breaking-rejoining protein, partial [Salmonella enterica subsp. enterica serovar Poona]
QELEVWPENLEKDKGWAADQLTEAQDVMDEVRILLVKAIQETADDDGE